MHCYTFFYFFLLINICKEAEFSQGYWRQFDLDCVDYKTKCKAQTPVCSSNSYRTAIFKEIINNRIELRCMYVELSVFIVLLR